MMAIAKKAGRLTTPRTGQGLSANIPGSGSFTVTWEALTMIVAFGGLLHCCQGAGGCRGQGLTSREQSRRNPFDAC